MLKKGSPFAFNIKTRMHVVCGLSLLVPLAILIQLFCVQTFQHEKYTDKAERTIYDYLAEDRLRGKILDTAGRSLAESVRTHSCGISKRYVQDKNATVDFLAETLDLPKKQILDKWKQAANFFFVTKKIKPDTYMKLAEVLHTRLGQGLELTPEYERIHPYGESALDIIGAANSKNLGLSGIELMYNRELSQDISKKRAKRTRRGDIIYDRNLKQTRAVANIYLTIDEVVQFYAERALQKAVEQVGAEHGIALVQDPANGKILAAASYPVKDGQSLAFQFTYEPGSTFKTVAVASAIDAGVVRVSDSIDMDNRKWEVVKGFTVRDKQHDKDFLSIPEIMQLSSNIGAGKIALELGPKNLFYYIKAFGFGSKTDVGFNGESKGSVPKYDTWTKVDTVTKGYGYGIAVTPIQLIGAYSAIANGGILMQPHLVDRLEYPDGSVDKKSKPVKIRRVVKTQTADAMKKVLQSVVEAGSGKRAQIKGYQIAGKTGTAEKLMEGGYGKTKHVVSFCGFAPVTNPRFTVLVILDNPSKYSFGGTAAAPVFKEIAEPLLTYLGVAPDAPDFERKEKK